LLGEKGRNWPKSANKCKLEYTAAIKRESTNLWTRCTVGRRRYIDGLETEKGAVLCCRTGWERARTRGVGTDSGRRWACLVRPACATHWDLR
jgi:hypothetical protein